MSSSPIQFLSLCAALALLACGGSQPAPEPSPFRTSEDPPVTSTEGAVPDDAEGDDAADDDASELEEADLTDEGDVADEGDSEADFGDFAGDDDFGDEGWDDDGIE